MAKNTSTGGDSFLIFVSEPAPISIKAELVETGSFSYKTPSTVVHKLIMTLLSLTFFVGKNIQNEPLPIHWRSWRAHWTAWCS